MALILLDRKRSRANLTGLTPESEGASKLIMAGGSIREGLVIKECISFEIEN
jgi:hypothetical protein